VPRYTLTLWICPHGHRNSGLVRLCGTCGFDHYQRSASIHPSERAVVDISPDGSISVPGRIDVPLHPKQIVAGVERVEVTSAIAGRHSLAHLEKLGLIHESTTWNSSGGNMPLHHEEMPDLTPKSVEQILSEPDAF